MVRKTKGRLGMQTKPFGIAVRDMLIDKGYVTAMGNPNWAQFALELPDLHYETLRKAVTGDRAPAEKVMIQVAEALGLDPNEFYEYALLQTQKQFDPRIVGEETAIANLQAWTKTASRRPAAAATATTARSERRA